MSVPDKALDAALKTGLDSHDWGMFEARYGDVSEAVDEAIRIALEAAAPFIAAQAWGEGEYAGYMNHSAEQRHGVEPHKNPYRSGNE